MLPAPQLTGWQHDMRNDGTPPRFELVDVRFANGQTARGVDPGKYRWTRGDARYPAGYGFDITDWQPAKP